MQPSLHLFDPKYSKNSIFKKKKYFYYLKYCFLF